MLNQENNKFCVWVRCMTYNHAPYITDALDGFAMQQTSFPFICTIIDDDSTDGEQEVINKYMEEHFDLSDSAVVRFEDTDDYHLVFARHKTNYNCFFAVYYLKYNHYSIKKSKLPYLAEWQNVSKYIALCEGDDFWTDTLKLQKQVHFLDNNNDYVLTYSDASIVDERGQQINARKSKRTSGDCTENLLLNGNFIITATVLFRAHLQSAWNYHRKGIPFDLKMGDKPMWLFLSKKGRFHYIENEMVSYRVLKNSASHFNTLADALSFIENGYKINSYYCKLYNIKISPKRLKKNYLKMRVRCAAKYSRKDFSLVLFDSIRQDPCLLFSKRILIVSLTKLFTNFNFL